MLDLVLDKEFANNFHLAYKGEEEYVDDFTNFFLKNLKRFKLISNYKNLEELKEHAKSNAILELIIERNPIIEFRPNLLNDIGASEFPDTGSPFKLILTGKNTKSCDLFRSRFGLEFFNPDNLAIRWKLYYSHRPDINRKTTNDPDIPDRYKFDSWEKCTPFIHPVNSFILTDKYLLKWKNERNFDKDINDNIIPLFEQLLAEAAKETTIDIMIISEIDESSPHPSQMVKVQRSYDLLKAKIAEKCNRIINLNILVYHGSLFSADHLPFHDRAIITNYFYIESGAGFLIFNNRGFRKSIEKNTEIKYRSILNIQNLYTTLSDLKQVDSFLKRIENQQVRSTHLKYYPAKFNRLLKFEHLHGCF